MDSSRKEQAPKFEPLRLVIARESRSLTKRALAELCQTSADYVGQIESGKRSPSADLIGRFSEILRYEPRFFMRGIDGFATETALWRALKSTTTRARKATYQNLFHLREIIREIDRLAPLPSVSIPKVSATLDDVLALSDTQIRGLALSIRGTESRLGYEIKLTDLLESNGAVIILTSTMDQKEDAVSIWDPVIDRPLIVLNDAVDSPCRQLFSLAHEFAHLVLHHGITAEQAADAEMQKVLDRQANLFAGEFLVPRMELNKLHTGCSLSHLVEIKRKTGLSVKAVITMLKINGSISKKNADSLYQQYSSRGWPHGEPLDDLFVFDVPTSLRDSMVALCQKAGITIEGYISSELGYKIREAEKLLGFSLSAVDSESHIVSAGATIVDFNNPLRHKRA